MPGRRHAATDNGGGPAPHRTDRRRAGTRAQRTEQAPTLRDGVVALAKSALLLVGVPATLARLWVLSSPPDRPVELATLAHLVLAAVGAAWLIAGAALVRDVVGALARRPLDPSTWSRRWALRLAALLLMLAAAVGAGASGGARALPQPRAVAGSTGALRSPASAAGGRSAAALLEAAAAAGLGAVIGAAVAQRAQLLRRATAALRRSGERLTAPTPAAAALEAFLAPVGDTCLLDWVDAASRLLWRSLRHAPAGTPVPAVVLVRAGPDGVELLLEHRAPEPVEGFVALEDGAWWCLDPALDLAELGRRTDGCGRLLPALVPVGEDGTAAYLFNVAPSRRLALGGDPGRAAQALRGILVGLRCLPWADELAVELVGLDPPGAAERCYHLSASSVEEIAALAAGPPIAPAARLATAWSRQPLVASALTPTPGHDALLSRCRGRAGVVSLGGRGDHELVLDEAGAWLEPLGIRLTPVCPSTEQLEAADRLLGEAGVPARPTRPAPAVAPSAVAARHAPAPLAEHGVVELRLLDGEPRLEGAAGDGVATRDRARVVELVSYLCLHENRAAVPALVEALFAGSASRGAERLERLLAAARAALGRAPDGSALLTREPGGHVTLRPAVTCDAARLAAAAAAARDAEPAEAELLLRDALALVGPGTCWSGPAPAWLVASGAREDLLAGIVDAAHHLALLALAKGDTVLARWAVEQGRHAEPCAELLARDLILACEADGDDAGAARAFEVLQEDLARLGGNEPSEETRELYTALSRGDR